VIGLPAMYVIRDVPVTYGDGTQRFRYGSSGTEADSFPFAIWRALPDVCPDKLPPGGYASIGFIYEPGREQPIGVSRRRVGGIDRMGFNCAACHVGGYKDQAGAFQIVDGMPNNRLDFARYIRFALQCVGDPRFEPDTVIAAIRKQQSLSGPEAVLYRTFVISKVRERTAEKEPLFDWYLNHPAAGPGRFDPPNSLKRMLGLPLPPESIGMVDYPAAWNQSARRNGFRHWDANSPSLAARDHVTAVAVSGGASQLVSTSELSWIESWLDPLPPAKYPFSIDKDLAARGTVLYEQHCALCHTQKALDVTPIQALATDRHRLDALSPELLAKLNGPGMHAEGAAQYRKTAGYSNVLLDGVWGRAPYLHNGSVPTMMDLLTPPDRRPTVFYNGSAVYDQQRLGFVSDGSGKEPTLFKFDTTLPGNGNRGHDYGTRLSDEEKGALIEYLKTR
jgi:mono/diheme cytochrome c family protein